MTALRDSLEDVVWIVKEATADGKITLPEVGRIFGEMAQAAAVLSRTLEDREANFEPLCRELNAIYDTHVAPIDLVGIPDYLERVAIDPLIKSMIRPWVAMVYSALGE